MAYGMQIKDSANQIVYSSASPGGVFVGFETLLVTGSTDLTQHTITYNGTGGKPNLYGLELVPVIIYSGDVAYKIVYPNGYPQIQYADSTLLGSVSYRVNTTLLVMAR
jgi:hypothetical protein